jgi:hypothetical protein
MKLIDEKGKLFGLINIVDFLVLLAVLLVLGGAVYKFKGPGGRRVHRQDSQGDGPGAGAET